MKDAAQIDTLRGHFIELGLHPAAITWLLDFFLVIQVFDDMADCESTDRRSLDLAIWAALYSLPANPFFIVNSHELLPCVSELVLKWKASDQMEKEGKADARSFMLRAGYYDLVLKVCQLSLGADWAMQNASLVYSLYGENYEDYRKEFDHA